MAIKGLSDRNLAFPEIGQIRKGGKKEGNRPGPDLEYFRVEFDEKEIDAARVFTERYGPHPQEISIFLPFNEIERMWDPFLEAYTAGRMVARADGEIYQYLVDTKTGEILVKNGVDLKTGNPRPYVDGQPVGTWLNRKTGKTEPVYCKPVGRLKVIVPDLGRAAYMTVMTTSIHDIMNLSDQMRAFKMLNAGQIAGIPLVLRRRPKMISTPSADGGRARRAKWLLSIEADPIWVQQRLQATQRLALPEGMKNNLLPSGEIEEVQGELIDDDDDNDGEVQGETGNDGQDGAQPKTDAQPQNSGSQPQTGSGQNGNGQPGNVHQDGNAKNGNGQRPYSPEQLQAKIGEMVVVYTEKGWAPKSTDRNMIAANLELCFAGEADARLMRRAVLDWLVGVLDVNELTNAQTLALKKWLDAQPDSGGEWKPCAPAVQEAKLVYREALVAQGQLEMVIEQPPVEEETLGEPVDPSEEFPF